MLNKYMELVILFFLFVLVVILKYMLIKKENLYGCSANCANIKIETTDDEQACLNCSYCGVCTTKNGAKNCVNGTAEKPLFVEDCASWNFGIKPEQDQISVGRRFFGYQGIDNLKNPYEYNVSSDNLSDKLSDERVNAILNENTYENTYDYNYVLSEMGQQTIPATTTIPATN